jgi:hypothetical protein
VPALPSSVLEPLWVQVAALLPTRQVRHPLGCHRPASLIGSSSTSSSRSWCSAAGIAASPTTPARRPPCAAAGTSGTAPGWPNDSAWRCWLPMTSCSAWNWSSWRWTAAPPRHPAAARPPGPAQWTAANKASSARSRSRRPASRWLPCRPRPTSTGDGLLAATLDALKVVGPLPAQPVVHLDAGYDYQPCRQVLTERGMVGQIATRGLPAPIQAGHRWVIERTHAWATSTASCAGAPSVAGGWWRSGWHWPALSWSVVAWSAAPGPTIAGTAALAAALTAYWRRL